MLEIWGYELWKGFGKMFLNPLLYWAILLFMLTGAKRIKRERKQFGTKVFSLFAEGKNTLFLSLVFGVLISFLAIFSGIIISVETMTVLVVVTMVLSITGSLVWLSASYTIGITFILLMILPFVPLGALEPYLAFQNLSIVHFISLAVLMGILLLVESLLVGVKTSKETFPLLSLSQRGVWVGQHEIKGLSFLPFFVLFPTEQLSSIAPIFPYFYYGEQSYSLLLFPFLLGFHYLSQGGLPQQAAKQISRATFWVSIVVLLLALASVYVPSLVFVAILAGLVGKEWVTYRHKEAEKVKPAFFAPLNQGIKVLGTIPNSPADRLGILVGETILKVNGVVVTSSAQLYEALQNSRASFKLEVLDYNGEVRFINSVLYDKDHHELGIIFPEHDGRPRHDEETAHAKTE